MIDHLFGHRLWNFLLAFFTPFIVSAIHFRYGFIFAGMLYNLLSLVTWKWRISPLGFAACNLTGAVVVYFFLYESADLSLESVDIVSLPAPCPDLVIDFRHAIRCIMTRIASRGHRGVGRLLDTLPAWSRQGETNLKNLRKMAPSMRSRLNTQRKT